MIRNNNFNNSNNGDDDGDYNNNNSITFRLQETQWDRDGVPVSLDLYSLL